jgi:hypothetical protein
MRQVARILLIAVLLAAVIAFFGCAPTIDFKPAPAPARTASVAHPGPPPPAPAHGYRHKHPDGVVLVYSSDFNVYVVSGYPDVYFHKYGYYRVYNGNWQESHCIDGPWRKCSVKMVPQGLQGQLAGRHGQ